MKKLVTVINEEYINTFKGKEDITLLYPLKDFCVGYNKEFDIDVIDDYCLVNRLLNDSEIDKLEELLKKSNIKGIVFDDLGLIEITKDLNITKILLLDHLSASLETVNNYLEYVDSVIVSNDLTEEEIRNIVNNADKKLVVNVFGLKTLMYSRRTLVSNYQEYHNLDKNNNINSHINDKSFKIIENKYGTKFYAWPYYNAIALTDLINVYYFWYDLILMDIDNAKKVILDNDISNIDNSRLFLDEKSVYKVSDLNG